MDTTSDVSPERAEMPAKPLMRGWSHALAACASIPLTIVLCWSSRTNMPQLISLLIFGVSMLVLYTVSACYHIGHWQEKQRRLLRTLDHANIFMLIAGTYTPLCFCLLLGWLRIALLGGIWLLAVLGMGLSIFMLRLPRWIIALLYISMGWVAIFAFPILLTIVSWQAVAMVLLGGFFYTIGAIIYACKRPDPFPRIFGFHEVFHLFVIAGNVTFVLCVWIWALHAPHM